uniref:Adhesion G protein-coupled receptor G3 n=1 Tax=Periophthalmus magnuspinnatus TaxID=409849 RepID=A0A3B4ADZ2_9GOBI
MVSVYFGKIQMLENQVSYISYYYFPCISGHWSTDGCRTDYNETNFICRCNHLSFFAVIVVRLSMYFLLEIGQNLAVRCLTFVFCLVWFIINKFFLSSSRRRPEKALGIHIQLAGAMLCLHQSFLVSSLVLWYIPELGNGRLCKALGLILHWSLLATLSWAVLEGFHLYLLLIRVFNIYVRKYVLKISVFGWVVCAIADVYGKYTVSIIDADNQTSIGHICWISSSAPHNIIATYVTTVVFPCLVIIYNGSMLGRVVCQLWGLRRADYMERKHNWKMLQKERITQLWKDAVTVLGLSCVLGLPWGLSSISYISTPGIYVFTVLNSLQGYRRLFCSVTQLITASQLYTCSRELATDQVHVQSQLLDIISTEHYCGEVLRVMDLVKFYLVDM